jgi:hypothetical protein
MLESLKDLYISYPFMPMSEPPKWFKHIKDIRIVVKLDAANIIFKYKNYSRGETTYVEGNWYAIRAYLRLINLTTMQAMVTVYCEQVQEEPIDLNINIYNWTDDVPGEQSYMLIDNDLATYSEDFGIPLSGYELQLDTVLFMQEAPHLFVSGEDCGHNPSIAMGHNVNVSEVDEGVLFYGATGAGLGVCKETDADVGKEVASRIPEDKQGLGITNINGIVNSIWFKGTFPVSIKQEDIKDGKIQLLYTEVE